jgi:hypothetical protein
MHWSSIGRPFPGQRQPPVEAVVRRSEKISQRKESSMKRLSLVAIALCGAAWAVALYAQAPDRAEVKVVVESPEPETEDAARPLPGMIYGPLRKDGSRDIAFRKSAVGKGVVVEGIAWGQPFGLKGQEGTDSPWVGAQIIHQGGSIFVRGIDFTETKARGKPVRVTGTLQLEPELLTRSSPTAGRKSYYYIEATTFESLDAVTDPYLVLTSEVAQNH